MEASAGSGKTFALAKRYVQLLLTLSLKRQPLPMRHILAITFTNKAAMEMKGRILEFLKKIALKTLPLKEEKEILSPLDLNQDLAQPHAFCIMEELIRHYNYFQVQTIDSFINALLCGCAFKIGLSANFKIKRNVREYLTFCLDELIEEAHGDEKIYKIFDHFLNQYLFIENRSGWFPKKDMLDLMEGLFRVHNTYPQSLEIYPLNNDQLVILKRKILKAMQKIRQELPEGMDSRFSESLAIFLERNSVGFDIDKISDYFSRELPPFKKGFKGPVAFARLWKKIRNDLEKLAEWEAYSIFNCYIEVFHPLLERFRQRTIQDDILFLPELNKRARALFDEGAVTVEELYYRLATRFHHYLIDEFQDTNRLQWQNLILMVEEALSTGGSLFYVGDKKQAIYGFRGGEVRLFDELKKTLQVFPITLETLQKNFRSQRTIVEFNNAVFDLNNLKRFLNAVMEKKENDFVSEEEDFQALENIFFNAKQEFKPENTGGYVKVEAVDIDKKEEREIRIKEGLIECLKKLKERYSLRDMAILTRSNLQVEVVTAWLMKEGIPVESERTTNIKENGIVRELVSFLKFLDSPIDNLNFSYFVLGDIFKCRSGLDSQEIHQFIFSLKQSRSLEKDFYVYKAFRTKFQQIWDHLIEDFFNNVGLYPPYELVISIFARFKILDHFPHAQGYLMRFLQLIKEKEEEFLDLSMFLEFYEEVEGEELYVPMPESEAIRILTIHKSKGLEFPVVLIPFLEMDIQVGSGRQDGQQSFLLEVKEGEMALIRLKKKYCKFSKELSTLWKREYLKSLWNELNSIYVALTRASRELYIWVPKKTSQSFNLANLLLPEGLSEIGRPRTQPQETIGLKSKIFSLPNPIYHNWLDYLKEEFIQAEEVIHREEILKGEILHFALSQIRNLINADSNREITKALSLLPFRYPQIKDISLYEKILQDVFDRKELRQFFYVEEGEIFNEKEIVNRWGETKRMDRLIIKKDEVWVVDYKVSHLKSEEYQTQVQGYMDILKSLYPKKGIRGFLIYLEELASEEIMIADHGERLAYRM